MKLDTANPSRLTAMKDSGMIPMINIVFLLLVFFMIAGQITPQEAISELPQASSEDPLPPARLEISVTADNVWWLNGSPVEGDLLSALQSAIEPGQPASVILKIQKDLPAQSINPVLEAANQLAQSSLHLATTNAP